MLTEKQIQEYQKKDKLTPDDGREILRDCRNRVVLSKDRLVHLLVLVHVQNNHPSKEVDFAFLGEFSVKGMQRSELQRTMRNYRSMCLHCNGLPHFFLD